MTNIDRDKEKLKLSYMGHGNVKYCASILENMVVPQKVKQRDVIWLCNSIPRYSPKRNENMFKPNLYMNVDSSVIHSNQNIETAPISTHFVEWINNCGIFMQWNNISSLKRNEILVCVCVC